MNNSYDISKNGKSGKPRGRTRTSNLNNNIFSNFKKNINFYNKLNYVQQNKYKNNSIIDCIFQAYGYPMTTTVIFSRLKNYVCFGEILILFSLLINIDLIVFVCIV
ncbi:hypothetical protein EDEG_02718 [Edhazardia aedis USNM 41457]|uniref:Uncharacterized protein n=1 Tax=Edhazardia aedis (strain USNM 41457) TaxID=1003232 RepID=J9D5R7_EDHAE|nr:hypothetical protein EDEG_02718 [Edhazardia aedis USNM 41457]|eukprot:EJW02894.1 hypothetical protein EDEG_02718 [Edhazardia aedis USNM 41457]